MKVNKFNIWSTLVSQNVQTHQLMFYLENKNGPSFINRELNRWKKLKVWKSWWHNKKKISSRINSICNSCKSMLWVKMKRKRIKNTMIISCKKLRNWRKDRKGRSLISSSKSNKWRKWTNDAWNSKEERSTRMLERSITSRLASSQRWKKRRGQRPSERMLSPLSTSKEKKNNVRSKWKEWRKRWKLWRIPSTKTSYSKIAVVMARSMSKAKRFTTTIEMYTTRRFVRIKI